MLYSALRRLLLGFNLLSAASGIPATINSQASTNCNSHTISITVTSENLEWAPPPFNNNYDVAQFIANSTRRGAATPLFAGKKNQTATYKIAATFCSPVNASGGTILMTSHGLGFDQSYWNSPYKPGLYNFKDYAVDRGYSVFLYDRLGVGASEKISGYVNQPSIQSAILGELTKLVRNGEYTGNVGKPNAVVLVGHSFGSYISNSLMVSNPTIADAAILTGIAYGSPNDFGTNPFLALGSRIASTQSPSKFSDRDTGYVTWTDVYTNAEAFFHQPDYEPDALNFSEDTKMPFGIAELLSLQTVDLNATNFRGPVLVLDGEYDFLACGGFCPGILQSGAEPFFKSSSNLATAVHPGAGHGFNFCNNATGSYGVMLDFVKSSGF
ncbi:MAG: hypothetical protein M1812_002133 [Candelaria pacifica]|nr:MAG: hypothetical protein M1812_002133 [Candelaria pacifica]